MTGQSADRVVVLWLILGGLLGSLLGVPYSVAVLADPAAGFPVDPRLVWLSAVAEALFFLAPASVIGVWVGRKVGLGPKVFSRILLKAPGCWGELRTALGASIGVGVVMGVLGLGQHLLPKGALGAGLENPTAVDCFMRCLSAALTEEIFFRLGLMTLLVWVIRSIARTPALHAISHWVGNILAALAFAGAHLPHVLLTGAAVWSFLIPLVLVSTLAGIVMGWLYMRHGLIAAVVAHFIVDFVVLVGPRVLTGIL